MWMLSKNQLCFKMRKIRSILNHFDDQREIKIPSSKLRFEDIWSIGIFTSDGGFCSQLQKDLRSSQIGCKWRCMQIAFTCGLGYLVFVQTMGEWRMQKVSLTVIVTTISIASRLQFLFFSWVFTLFQKCSKI